MKAVYMVAALTMACFTCTAATTGSIGVKLTIYSQCHIGGKSTIPAVDCGQQVAARSKITQTVISKNYKTRQTSKLVTVEW